MKIKNFLLREGLTPFIVQISTFNYGRDKIGAYILLIGPGIFLDKNGIYDSCSPQCKRRYNYIKNKTNAYRIILRFCKINNLSIKRGKTKNEYIVYK